MPFWVGLCADREASIHGVGCRINLPLEGEPYLRESPPGSIKNNPAKGWFAGLGHKLVVFMTLATSFCVLLAGPSAGGRPLVTTLVFMALATSFCMLFTRATTGITLI